MAPSSPLQRRSSDDPSSTLLPATESTPLLHHIPPHPTAEPIEDAPGADLCDVSKHVSASDDEEEDEEEDVPLPLTQIFLLCYSRLVEPITFFSIFPFINQMIYNIGDVKKEDVGFYSGLIESLFSLVQMCVMVPWGKVGLALFIWSRPLHHIHH
jgi:hypothetical protein